MNSIEIPWRGIYKEYAGSWDEITPNDAPYIGRCLYWLEGGNIDIDMFRKLVVDRLLGRVNDVVVGLKGEKLANFWVNEGQLAATVEFFFKKREENGVLIYEVVPDFTKNLVPRVGGVFRRQYGPGDFLGEVCFAEYKDLLFCSDKFMQSKDEIWLTRMMAISYRPRRYFLWLLRWFRWFDGRERVRYNSNATDYRMKRFEGVDIGAKYMFFYYIMGCLYIMRNDNYGQGIEIDGNSCFFSLIFNRGSGENKERNDNDKGIGLTGVMMAIAESGVFGDIKATAQADVWDVLTRLYQLELERRDFDDKIKK